MCIVVCAEDMRPLKCELCGKVDFAYRFKESKRFCSMACAKRYNVSSVRKMALLHPKMPAKGAKKKTPDDLNMSRDASTLADDVSEVCSVIVWYTLLAVLACFEFNRQIDCRTYVCKIPASSSII